MSINAKQSLRGKLGTGTRVEVPTTYILVDEDDNEFAAVRMDEAVNLTATAKDIRLGMTAITKEGIVVGEAVF